MTTTDKILDKTLSRRYKAGIVAQRDSKLDDEKRAILHSIITERKDALDALAKY